MANKYCVHVCLEGDYMVVADNEDDAFIFASDYAMYGGDWQHSVDLVEENVNEDEG